MTQAERILNAIKFFGEIVTQQLYRTYPDLLRSSIRQSVYHLIDQGKVERVSRGVYRYVEPRGVYRYVEPREIEEEEEEPMRYKVVVGLNGVNRRKYFSITVAYVGSSYDDCVNHIDRLIKMIEDKVVEITGGYTPDEMSEHGAAYTEPNISDIYPTDDDYGYSDVDVEWLN